LSPDETVIGTDLLRCESYPVSLDDSLPPHEFETTVACEVA
jgi:hypothetical protein